ncbi:MAG: amino acid ABC transporter ATP-binding protein [Puniceicoccaceae bacterium]|nr:MAG: amino acid ABC transporter ATP-binding protein [Puniceicoccaceae bacterium]
MRLEIHQLSKTFDGQAALDRLDYSLDDGHTLAVIGPSGGGKSTLLRLLAGLDLPTSGTIRLNGERLPDDERRLAAYRRTVGTVFQAFNLFPHLDALANIALPLEVVHRLERSAARDRAHETLRRFRLDDHAHKRPAELSGGQRQRVAIARAIAIRPRLLFFDEPTSALDPEMTAEVLDLIRELRDEGLEFVCVTHEMGFARVVADQVLFLADGRAVEAGPAASFFANPQTPAARSFLERILKY